MKAQPTAAARTAIRALHDGAPVTLELLSQATGRSIRTLRGWAKNDGWESGQTGDPATLEERLLVLSDRLIRGLETVSARGEGEGETYDKTRIDALTAMLRMVEKIGEITRGPERAKENQTATDAEMASILERIDERILELAKELALQLVQSQSFKDTGVTDLE